MNPGKWDRRFHWNELDGLRKDFDRLLEFGSLDTAGQLSARSFAPAADVTETDTDVLVKCNLPGVKTEDVEVSMRDRVLTIKGEKKGEKDIKEKHYHRKETWEGKFQRSFSLPVTVDQTKIEAVLKDGVLTVKMQKKQATEAKMIPVQS